MLRLSAIAQPGLRQGETPLHIDRIDVFALELRHLGAGGVFIAIGKIHFRQAQTRIAVVQLLAQHPLILSNRRLAVAALLRPVRQRQRVAHRRRLLLNQRDGPVFLAVVAQLVCLTQHVIALQARLQLADIVRPLPARQGVNLRQRHLILIIPG